MQKVKFRVLDFWPVDKISRPVDKISGPVDKILRPVDKILGAVDKIFGPVDKNLKKKKKTKLLKICETSKKR